MFHSLKYRWSKICDLGNTQTFINIAIQTFSRRLQLFSLIAMCHCFPTLPLRKPLLCAYQPYLIHARRFIQLSIPLVNGPPVSIIPCLLLGSPGIHLSVQYPFICSFKSHGEGCFSCVAGGCSVVVRVAPPPCRGSYFMRWMQQECGAPPLHSCCIKGGGHYVASGP